MTRSGGKVAEDGSPEQSSRLNQVRAATPLHPHRDPRNGMLLLLPLLSRVVCGTVVVLGVELPSHR